MPRMVQCVKLGRELPGLEKPPFPGELGQRIYEHVSQQAWNMWPAQATIIINHYGLSLADPSAQQILLQQMEEFFFGENAQMPEGWSPQGQASKGAPQRKK
ncbi:MAG TPA: oxidative damage protection protein [Roseiflexaceae bacterium]|nr:oxidative damage protection protein [Roseiflexaceae bacterium]